MVALFFIVLSVCIYYKYGRKLLKIHAKHRRRSRKMNTGLLSYIVASSTFYSSKVSRPMSYRTKKVKSQQVVNVHSRFRDRKIRKAA